MSASGRKQPFARAAHATPRRRVASGKLLDPYAGLP
jgi:hypothetical protein